MQYTCTYSIEISLRWHTFLHCSYIFHIIQNGKFYYTLCCILMAKKTIKHEMHISNFLRQSEALQSFQKCSHLVCNFASDLENQLSNLHVQWLSELRQGSCEFTFSIAFHISIEIMIKYEANVCEESHSKSKMLLLPDCALYMDTAWTKQNIQWWIQDSSKWQTKSTQHEHAYSSSIMLME